MPSIAINLEIGHDAYLKEKITDGCTHDWEVFVRGCNGADIKHYVDRVVFLLHETFEKPKWVLKEPPYSVRTSGYGGFDLLIEIYLKNNQEPRKIQFKYCLTLQTDGPPIHNVQKEKYIFQSVSEDFRHKLLKGGAVVVSGSRSYHSSFHSGKSANDRPQQMTSKPRFGGGTDQPKKYKTKPDEPRSDQFTDLFGTPITKTSRVQEVPKNKESSKPVNKSGDKEKGDRLSDKGRGKNLSKDKERDREKDKSRDKDKMFENNLVEKKIKDEKKDKRDKRDYKKDKKDRRDRDKEKERERDLSPAVRPKSPSPKRSPKKVKSPSPVRSNIREREAVSKESKDKEKEKEKKSKKHKERHREKDKEKERVRDQSLDYTKEYKSRDARSIKDKEKETSATFTSIISESKKEKDQDSGPITHKPEKNEKAKEDKEPEKIEEKAYKEQEKEKREEVDRHKHKKKDKDRKEKKEKEEKLHKKDKEKKLEKEKTSLISPSKELAIEEKEKTDNLFGVSPRSEPPPSPPLTKIEPDLPAPVSNMEAESSIESKPSTREPSPISDVVSSSHYSSPPCQSSITDSTAEDVEPSNLVSSKKGTRREKKRRRKERKREERKRKVEAETQVEVDVPPVKVEKKENSTNARLSDDERMSSGETANRVHFDEDYMNELRELQLKIGNLQDQRVVQDVVNLIAETGPYEVSDHTIDFDLCMLNRETVRQLQTFFKSLDC